jgi:UDP-glucose 4-epimerase
MNVLVTGGAGYIGSHAVLALVAAGHRPVVVDNLSTGVADAVPDGVRLHVAEVADTQAISDILQDERIEAVMHFAGSIVVPESVADPGSYYKNNTAASLDLARTCVAVGLGPFIFSSTAAVYGAPETLPVTEQARPAPLSPYGWSKLMTEQMLFDLHRAHPGFRPLCLRYFNVAGADPGKRTGQRGPQSTHLIRCAIETALGARPVLEIFGEDYPTRDGSCERDFIHVSDLADAHVAGLDYLRRGGPPVVLNCGYGRGATVHEVVAALELEVGRPLPTKPAPRRPGDSPSVVADVSEMRRRLNWRPRHDSLETILRTALAWEALRPRG